MAVKPNMGEKRVQFVNRCMVDVDMTSAYPDEEDRFSVCLYMHEEFCEDAEEGGDAPESPDQQPMVENQLDPTPILIVRNSKK